MNKNDLDEKVKRIVELAEKINDETKSLSPKALYDQIDNLIIGNTNYKKSISIALADFLKKDFQRNHLLVVGPSRSGKTHLLEKALPQLNLPFYIIDCANLVPSGYKGKSLNETIEFFLSGVPRNSKNIIILDEFVSEDMGIRQFANEIVKPHLINKYGGYTWYSVGDPAGNIRAQTDEKTCLQELLEAGIPTEPAPTNDFIPRREAVAFFLTKMADGQPAFALNPRCTTIRKGLGGRYKFERLKTTGNARYKDRPVKDIYSHIQDALQYLCLRVRSGLTPARARSVSKKSAKGWT